MKRLPRTLYRYLGSELLAAFLLSLGALSFLFVILGCIQAVNLDFSLRIAFPWILESMGYYLYFTVPVSLLFASTLVFGRCVAEREYTAIAAGGISPLHVFLPMAILALALTGIAISTCGTFLPHCHYRKRNIHRYLIQQLANLGEGRELELRFGDDVVYCKYYKGSALHDVWIRKEVDLEGGALLVPATYDGEEARPRQDITISAKSAAVSVDKASDELVLTLSEIDILFEHPDSKRLTEGEWLERLTGWERISSTGLLVRHRLSEKAKSRGDKSTAELWQSHAEQVTAAEKLEASLAAGVTGAERDTTENALAAVRNEKEKIESEIWRRRALSLSCFSFAFLGFPISLTLRQRHRLVSFFLGVTIVLVVFYPLLLLGDKFVEWTHVPASVALLSGNIILLIIAGFLTGRLLRR